MSADPVAAVDLAIASLVRQLEQRRVGADHWEGHLASSALSTGAAVLAMQLTTGLGHQRTAALRQAVSLGVRWLVDHQNADGGWGDTVRSRTNISTTAVVWAALSAVASLDTHVGGAAARAGVWLEQAAGGTSPEALRSAILRRYGKDRTFSVPILTVLALAGKLGADPRAAWRTVPQLPFELAALPHRWFHRMRLPVVSYALPALIAIGQVRHAHAPSRNPAIRGLRDAVRERTHTVLHEMQPESGGYLEATPLTSFVVMSLAGMGYATSPVLENGIKFLLDSQRGDGSWPIDTNLATWVTTLSVGALADAGRLAEENRSALRQWLLCQQSTCEHPFTHAAPGAWAWTPLSGGVSDADDTSGALLALHALFDPTMRDISAASAGVRWLLGLQNRDGGVPTFCRGWGTLPFDRSTPEITAHALRAWSAWYPRLDGRLQQQLRRSSGRAVAYLSGNQREDGSWVPLWFGNERAAGEDNPVYGTARTLEGLQTELVRGDARAARSSRAAVRWLLHAQNPDGGWGGDCGVPSSIEETGVVLSALCLSSIRATTHVHEALARGAAWLTAATASPLTASPVGLYFARLWYYEELYPIVFALAGLSRFRSAGAGTMANDDEARVLEPMSPISRPSEAGEESADSPCARKAKPAPFATRLHVLRRGGGRGRRVAG
jgi:squalene-hopene/tetraprenyl-beta-curcumene cyclase